MKQTQPLRKTFNIFLTLASCLSPINAEEFRYKADWSSNDNWAGPDFWARPLFSWSKGNNALIAKAGPGRTLYFMPWEKTEKYDTYSIKVTASLIPKKGKKKDTLNWMGFSIGNHQKTDEDYRKILVNTNNPIKAGINSKGQLVIANKVSEDALPSLNKVRLKLNVNGTEMELSAQSGGKTISLKRNIPLAKQKGLISLMAVGDRNIRNHTKRSKVSFADFEFNASGENAEKITEADITARQFGPIAWSQYSLAANTMTMSVQCLPVEGTITLETKNNDSWKAIGKSAIDPLSRTAFFVIDDWDSSKDTPYRVSMTWNQKSYYWDGTVRKEPEKGSPLKIAAFSCDYGYIFPSTIVVNNVKEHDPDVLFFAGDQIYEAHGGYFENLVRFPIDRSLKDYLRKWYQFGWTWRELLKDRPSLIIMDDHDVFQGNIWGDGGRIRKNYNTNHSEGGYTQPVEWVNATQRTQVQSLPKSHAGKTESGILNYYTDFEYAGIPIAILEDRKYKTGNKQKLKENQRLELLGSKQEAFLKEWVEKTAESPARLVLSQTIFSRASTHGGRELKRSRYDYDSNGWPKEGRDRALSLLQNNPNTLMVCGDQHFGVFLRHGIKDFEDGPYALMVPGTSNWWPRAIWPKGPDAGPESWTGNRTDYFGNKMTVYGAANPEPGTTIKIDMSDPIGEAHRRGSGYGLIEVDTRNGKIVINMYRTKFDAKNPKPSDQFFGFPQKIKLKK